MTTNETKTGIDVKYTSNVSDAANKDAAALNNVADATVKSQKEVERASRSWEQQRRSFEENYKQSVSLERALNSLQNSLSAGEKPAAQVAGVYSGIIDRFGTAAVSARLLGAEFAKLSASIGSEKYSPAITAALQSGTDSSRAASIEALRNKYVPLAAAQQQYVTDLKTIKTAGNDVFKTEDERAAAITRTKDAFARQVVGMQASRKAAEEHTQATKLQNYQLINFGQQIQDIGVSLAGGQNPFMVMVQQVPQMASAVGGVDKIGLAFRSLMTPMVMAAATAATVGGAIFLIGKHAYDAGEQLKALTTGMELVGRGSSTAGLLQGTVNTSVEGSSASRKEGVAAASTFSGNLNISTDAMKSALVAARALAEVTGTTMPEAASKLNNALEGGFDGLVKFNQSYRTLSPAQLEVIRNLQQQGQFTSATTIALTSMAEGLDRLAKDHLSPFGKALAAIGDIYNGVTDAATRSLRAMTPQEKIDQLREELRVAQEYANRPLLMKSLTGSGARSESEVQKDIDSAKATQEALKELDKQRAEFTKKDDLRTQDSSNKLAVDRATAVGAVSPARAGIEDIRQREKLEPNDLARSKIIGERLVAEKQLEISQRREVEQLDLQAAAERRLADAAGQGIVAQMAAERQNKLAFAAYQDGTRDLTNYAAALSAADAAKIEGMQSGWVKETERETNAARALADAWRGGDTEAIKRATNEKEAISLTKQFGLSLEEARRKVEAKNAAMAAPEVQKGLTALRQQVELTERLAELEGTGNTVGARRASINAAMETYGQSNPNASDGDRAAQRALLERQQQAGLKGQAYALQAQMDPVVARKKALAELSDLEQQHILSEEDIARRRMEINIAYEQGEIDKLEATRTFTGGAEAAMKRYALDSSNYATMGAGLVNRSIQSIEDGFAGLISGTKTAGQAFMDFSNVIMNEISKMAAKALIAQAMTSAGGSSGMLGGLFSSIGSMFGSGGGGGSAPVGDFSTTSAPVMTAASGGLITGPGTGTSDSIPAWLSNGEFVSTAEATKKNLPLLMAMNDNKFADGGMVGYGPSMGSSSGSGAATGGVVINYIDQRSGGSNSGDDEVNARDRGIDANGMRVIELVVTSVVQKKINSGAFDKALQGNFGTARQGITR